MIGIFDSGCGGLSVLKALRQKAPQTDIIYFGDIKNAPYGNKTREEVGALTIAGFERLLRAGATEIISACNSVSASIADPLLETVGVPKENVIEMTKPVIADFADKRDARILLVATPITVESGIYERGFASINMRIDSIALPELAGGIESGMDSNNIYNLILNYVSPINLSLYTHLILGCTHYPLVTSPFKTAIDSLGHPSITIYDPAFAVAEFASLRFSINGSGKLTFLISQDSAVFRRYAKQTVCEPYKLEIIL